MDRRGIAVTPEDPPLQDEPTRVTASKRIGKPSVAIARK